MIPIQANPRAQIPQTGISSNPFSIAKKFCDCIAKSFVLLIDSFIGSGEPIKATLPPPADPTTKKTASAAQAGLYQSSSPETPSTPDRSADDFKERRARERAIDKMKDSKSSTAPVAPQLAIAASPDYKLLDELPIPEELKKNQDYINLLRTLSTAIRSNDVPKIIEIFKKIITKYPDMHSVLAELENKAGWEPLLDHLHSQTKYKDILATQASLPPDAEEMRTKAENMEKEKEKALKQAPTSATRPPIRPEKSALTELSNAVEKQKKLDKAIELGKKALPKVYKSTPEETESVYRGFALACLNGEAALKDFLTHNVFRTNFWNAIDPNKPETEPLREEFGELLAPRIVDWKIFKPEERPHTTPAPLTTSRSVTSDYDYEIELFKNELSPEEISRIKTGHYKIIWEKHIGCSENYYKLVRTVNDAVIKYLGNPPVREDHSKDYLERRGL